MLVQQQAEPTTPTPTTPMPPRVRQPLGKMQKNQQELRDQLQPPHWAWTTQSQFPQQRQQQRYCRPAWWQQLTPGFHGRRSWSCLPAESSQHRRLSLQMLQHRRCLHAAAVLVPLEVQRPLQLAALQHALTWKVQQQEHQQPC